jgi:hypothetical protein
MARQGDIRMGEGRDLTFDVMSHIVTHVWRGSSAVGGGSAAMGIGRTATKDRIEERSSTGVAEADPAFHRAILKIALELKKPSARSYDAIVEQTIRSMKLDPDRFRRFLGENGGRNMNLLVAAARRIGS